MSTHNIGFNEDLTKIVFELSSNTRLISSAEKNINTETYPPGTLNFIHLVISIQLINTKVQKMSAKNIICAALRKKLS